MTVGELYDEFKMIESLEKQQKQTGQLVSGNPEFFNSKEYIELKEILQSQINKIREKSIND